MATAKEAPQTVQPKKSFSESKALPFAIAGILLAIGMLASAGYIELPKLGKYLPGQPPKEETNDIVTIKMADGVVGAPYSDNILNYIRNMQGVTCPCKYDVEEMMLPGGLKFGANDGSLSGVPQFAGTWVFDVCLSDSAGYEGCLDNIEFSVTIKPKPKPRPSGICPTKPSPPCGSKQNGGKISPTTVGVLTYEGCECPEGTYNSGQRDTITTPGTVYIICKCG